MAEIRPWEPAVVSGRLGETGGLVQAAGQVTPEAWQRFLDIQLAGMRTAGPLSPAPPISVRKVSKLGVPRHS